jgi:hypothetical protein
LGARAGEGLTLFLAAGQGWGPLGPMARILRLGQRQVKASGPAKGPPLVPRCAVWPKKRERPCGPCMSVGRPGRLGRRPRACAMRLGRPYVFNCISELTFLINNMSVFLMIWFARRQRRQCHFQSSPGVFRGLSAVRGCPRKPRVAEGASGEPLASDGGQGLENKGGGGIRPVPRLAAWAARQAAAPSMVGAIKALARRREGVLCMPPARFSGNDHLAWRLPWSIGDQGRPDQPLSSR